MSYRPQRMSAADGSVTCGSPPDSSRVRCSLAAINLRVRPFVAEGQGGFAARRRALEGPPVTERAKRELLISHRDELGARANFLHHRQTPLFPTVYRR